MDTNNVPQMGTSIGLENVLFLSLENVPSPQSTTRSTRLSIAQSMQSKIRFFPDTNITLRLRQENQIMKVYS